MQSQIELKQLPSADCGVVAADDIEVGALATPADVAASKVEVGAGIVVAPATLVDGVVRVINSPVKITGNRITISRVLLIEKKRTFYYLKIFFCNLIVIN